MTTVHKSLCSFLVYGSDDDVEPDPRHDDLEEEIVRSGLPDFIDYRPSPVCHFAPSVCNLLWDHVEIVLALLNGIKGAIPDNEFSSERTLEAAPPTRKAYLMNLMRDEQEFQAVKAEVERHEDWLSQIFERISSTSPKEVFTYVAHQIRDYRLLLILAGLRREHVSLQVPHIAVRRFNKSEQLRAFYKVRDAMRRDDPEERKAALARDAKRRTTQTRKEYLAEFNQKPEVKKKDAERKRLARAAKKAALLAPPVVDLDKAAE